MKITPWDDVRSGSSIRLGNSARDESEESLFSLLVKVENRLRAGVKADSRYGLGRHKSSRTKASPHSLSNNLSRYIE